MIREKRSSSRLVRNWAQYKNCSEGKVKKKGNKWPNLEIGLDLEIGRNTNFNQLKRGPNLGIGEEPMFAKANEGNAFTYSKG